MKKIFIVTGELSGDITAGWYLNKIKEKEEIVAYAVGGQNLQQAGAIIYDDFNKLNIAGVVEILGRLKFIFSYLKKITNYILENNFDELILVDFPGFNLMLAKAIKKKNKKIKITYVSPPQVWIWGEYRIKKLKKYCDNLIVMYPFEVDWYKTRGLNAQFLGNPLCENLKAFIYSDLEVKNQIAILPGSRKQEIVKLMPVLSWVIKKILAKYPDIRIIFPVAKSLDVNFVTTELNKYNLENYMQNIVFVLDEEEKKRELKQSILAITKPGTVSLELALLGVPSIIIYKTSWLTYWIAKLVVNIKCMGLPNLFSKKIVFKEFIQGDCKENLIVNEVDKLYNSFINKQDYYFEIKKDLEKIKKNLCQHECC
ncbi:lipid-A-disaccharide synthase [Candidatus Dependentiae bacterium]|nr:lipid-A-disaccharide synthase [Candidatus Dependentiae bacterium]MCG2756249.1 lipid-A-disaccharide synthase [Candidatus Dependentiae bacterium]